MREKPPHLLGGGRVRESVANRFAAEGLYFFQRPGFIWFIPPNVLDNRDFTSQHVQANTLCKSSLGRGPDGKPRSLQKRSNDRSRGGQTVLQKIRPSLRFASQIVSSWVKGTPRESPWELKKRPCLASKVTLYFTLL